MNYGSALIRACRDRDVSVEDEILVVHTVRVRRSTATGTSSPNQTTIGMGLASTVEQSGWGITRHHNSGATDWEADNNGCLQRRITGSNEVTKYKVKVAIEYLSHYSICFWVL